VASSQFGGPLQFIVWAAIIKSECGLRAGLDSNQPQTG
jgi:hypothetical protein